MRVVRKLVDGLLVVPAACQLPIIETRAGGGGMTTRGLHVLSARACRLPEELEVLVGRPSEKGGGYLSLIRHLTLTTTFFQRHV